MTTTQNYHFKVGSIHCVAICDGTEVVPIDTVFKDAPAELVKNALIKGGYPTGESTVYFNCLFMQAGQQRILIDAGWGKGVGRRGGELPDRLQDEGFSPADIDTIILTHGDIDHIGGILTGDNQLAFPNAGYIMLKEAWDFWTNQALIARWPEFLTYFGRKVLPVMRERVKIVEAGVEFLPGFQLIPACGHRPGHAALAVTSQGEYFIHLADTVGHPILMEHPEWHWYADFAFEQAEKDKFHVLNQAVAQHALVFGPHLPFPGVGRVAPLGVEWRWQPNP
jgi:glyoxylase-like metal-dependent hydrolase (beta-lactamase superfamily II)